jgi:hypothetical protein
MGNLTTKAANKQKIIILERKELFILKTFSIRINLVVKEFKNIHKYTPRRGKEAAIV